MVKGFEWRLENLRDKHGYTQKEVSRKLGFSENTYGQYESGKRKPDYDTLIKLADLYQVTVNYLLRGEETAEHQSWNTLLSIYKKHGFEHPPLMDIDTLSSLDEKSIVELIHFFESLVNKPKNK